MTGLTSLKERPAARAGKSAILKVLTFQSQDGSPIWRLSNESLTKESAIEFICSSFLMGFLGLPFHVGSPVWPPVLHLSLQLQAGRCQDAIPR